MANEIVRAVQDSGLRDGLGYFRNSCVVGNNWLSGGYGPIKGALRFTNVTITQGQSIDFAAIYYSYYAASNSGSGNWKYKLYGIKETNTDDFGSDPFGRTKTTASSTTDDGGGGPQHPGFTTKTVTSMLQEIVNQGGWSSGNAMGFIFEDDGSFDPVWATASNDNSYLVYRVSAEPNFKPTPISISAPTIPTAENYGLKFSSPGISVLTATEEQTTITTGKKQFKVHMEGEVTATGASITVAHGLGYVPFVMLFIKFNSLTVWEKMPSSGFNSYYVNSTNLIVPNLVSGDKIYYYIFLDELNT